VRVLIAEDDAVSRCLLEATLAKWGYEVIVTTDGLQVSPLTSSSDLGMGYDLVLSRYFKLLGATPRRASYVPGEDNNYSIRLRASMFQPGAAYGPDAANRYRITLEGTLWFY